MKLLAFVASLLVMSSVSQACPLGARETTLTVSRVMRNLGRFLMPAEMVVLKGLNPAEKIKDTDLQESVTKLDVAISCVDAVIASPTGELLPVKAQGLEGQALADYVERYVYYMDSFKTLMVEFREMLVQTAAMPPETRNFPALKAKMEEIDKTVNHAHKRL